MNNPFIEDNHLCTNASLNKLFIEKMPICKVKQNLEGKTALEIFSTKLFIKEIKEHSKELKLNLNKVEEKMLPQYLNELLDSSDISVRKCAGSIVKMFGERLGIILLVLKIGDRANREKRKDWDDTHWDYFRQLKNVILVGGLSSSKIGERLKKYIKDVFAGAGEPCYNIILIKDSSNIGIKGCSRYIKDVDKEKIYLLFDCGQTFIKRSILSLDSKENKKFVQLSKVSSSHVGWNSKNETEEKEEAIKLSDYLEDVIINTIKESKCIEKELASQIVISIANYVKNGEIANRGGYGKLRLLDNNYETYLENKIYEKIKRRFKITLVHDGTAISSAFVSYDDAVCISLGTAFGVGFPTKV